MKYLAGLAVLCAVLPLAGAAGSAPPGAGTIAFAGGGYGQYGQTHLYTIEADGTGLTNLTAAYPAAWFLGSPRWSPDGARLAYTQYDSTAESDIYLLEPGGSRRQLTNVSGREDEPIWSPDGDQIAFTNCCIGGGGSQLVVMDAGGGNWQAIVNETTHGYDWSTRDEIAYTVLNGSTYEIHVVKPDGTGHRVLGEGRGAIWSPTGDRVAFLARPSGNQRWSRLSVMGSDGSGRREVSSREADWGGHSWSPDGREIAFTPIVGEYRGPYTHVYAVDVDSGRERRLAGAQFERYSSAAWSPDGFKVAIGLRGELAVVNAEGTCYLPLRTSIRDPFGAAWRPGTGGAPFLCSHLTATGAVSTPIVRQRHRLTYSFGVVNHGAMPAHDLRLVARLTGSFTPVSVTQDRGACRVTGLTLQCEVERLGVGESMTTQFVIRPQRAGPLRAVAQVSAREVDPNPADNEVQVAAHAYACSVLGTPGRDVLNGTRRNDVVCALDGDDSVQGLAGRDFIAAGPGNDEIVAGRGRDLIYGQDGEDRILAGEGADLIRSGREPDRISAGRGPDVVAGGDGSDTINPGRGRDKVWGGSGDDRIVVLDHARDFVDCGRGLDVVLADPRDRVALDCENVRRVR